MTLTTGSVYDRALGSRRDRTRRLSDNGPVSISHVQLFSIPVTDRDRARKFPVGTLGLELVADTGGIVLQETAVQP
jgi:hypothetical protein